MDAVLVEAVHLTRVVNGSRGPKAPVRDVSFRPARGHAMTVVGPSGAERPGAYALSLWCNDQCFDSLAAVDTP